jgi:hypothetical protein
VQNFIDATGQFALVAGHYDLSEDLWNKDLDVIYDAGDVTIEAFDVTANQSGEIAVVFIEDDAAPQTHLSLYDPQGSWSGIIDVDNASDETGATSLMPFVLSESGQVRMVLTQYNGHVTNLMSRTYDATTGWTPDTYVETYNAQNVKDPILIKNSADDVFALWQGVDEDNVGMIWSNRLNPDNSWGQAELVETYQALGKKHDSLPLPPLSSPYATINENGNIVATWQQSDGTDYNIWSNWYRSPR